MKKFYLMIGSLMALGIGAANADDSLTGVGEITYQFDMNMGQDEPDYFEAETEPVEVSYLDGELTLTASADAQSSEYPIAAPIIFSINLETGEALATDQISMKEEGDDYSFTYYYADLSTTLESENYVVKATINNLEDGSGSILTISPWGQGLPFAEMDMFFFAFVYSETTVKLPFAIPGLAGETVEEPVLEIDEVSYDIVEVDGDYSGFYLEFTVSVLSENLPEDAKIDVYYQGPSDDSFKQAQQNEDGTYTFNIAGLEISETTEYEVTVYAQSGTTKSEEKVVPFKYMTSGINSIGNVDTATTRYFNLNGQEVINPANGGVYLKVSGNKVEKVLVKQ